MSKLPSECQVGGDWYKKFVIQPIEFAVKNNLGPCETSVLKYICRHSLKDGAKDIHKAIHYLKLVLEYQYGEVAESKVCPVQSDPNADMRERFEAIATPAPGSEWSKSPGLADTDAMPSVLPALHPEPFRPFTKKEGAKT